MSDASKIRRDFGHMVCPEGSGDHAGSIGPGNLPNTRITFNFAGRRVWAEQLRRESIAQMVERLGDPKSVDLAGVTPLMRAAEFGRADVMVDLLKRGADPNVKSSSGDRTALFSAIAFRVPETVSALLAAGADPNGSMSWNDAAPLHIAASAGNITIVKALLAAHAKPDIATTGGETPLLIAARADYVEIAAALIAAGVDVNIIAKNGLTPLKYAVSSASPAMIKLLMQKGAKPEVGPGGTALHALALGDGDPEKARVLLQLWSGA